ncbi:MAG TPA: HIT domain-containing protein [Burkholderiales bacterium]|nr:HIT domain-containing protein [Burkholderiales bacterium]
MALIYEARHFELLAPERPHVTRADGGHIVINPKLAVEDRTQLDRERAVELMKLTMVAGEAMKTVLTRKGIEIGRINYNDNGNWRHELHVHLYGRALNATIQKWGTFLQIPPTRERFNAEMGALEPLNAGDIADLRAEIERLLASDKYRAFS